MKTFRFLTAIVAACLLQTPAMAQTDSEPSLVHPAVGTTAAAADSSIRLSIVSKHQNFDQRNRQYLDAKTNRMLSQKRIPLEPWDPMGTLA